MWEASPSWFYTPPTAGDGECLQLALFSERGTELMASNSNPRALSPTRSSFPPGPSSVSEKSSYGVSPYAPPIGRGPSPGPSVACTNTTNSSGGAGGGGGVYYNNPRSAKEREALGIRGSARDEPFSRWGQALCLSTNVGRPGTGRSEEMSGWVVLPHEFFHSPMPIIKYQNYRRW